jgi:hypothetical protein
MKNTPVISFAPDITSLLFNIPAETIKGFLEAE